MTVPLPLRMQTPRCRRRAKVDMLSTISAPLATSTTWERRALGLSRVMMMGGFGLFLEPAGRPLGLLVTSLPPLPPDSFPSVVGEVVAAEVEE